MPRGERFMDVGGDVWSDEAYTGPVLVVFAVDPGVSTGWSALKVPVAALAEGGVARTLPMCRHRHGTIRRSAPPALVGGAGAAWSPGDTPHVSAILDAARAVHDEWMPEWVECTACEGSGELDSFDPDTGVKVGVNPCFLCEGEGGAWDTDNDSRFVFVMEGFDLRESSMDPSLLSPVRVASVLMDRLRSNESDTPVFFQKVSDAKNVVSDDRLKRWGMYDPASGPHARDADRHAVLFLRSFASVRQLRRGVFGPDPFFAGREGEG